MSDGEFTRREILSQPEVWRSTIQDIQLEFDKVVNFIPDPFSKKYFILGCGSTYYLSVAAAYLLRKKGFQASAHPSSDFVFFANVADLKDSVFVLISRSGTTTETLWALEKVRMGKSQPKVIVITVRPQSPLAKQSDLLLAAPHADEESVAQTRSFTSMYLLAQFLSETLHVENNQFAKLIDIPEKLEQIQNRYFRLMEDIGNDLSIKRFFFLGGGPLYGIACEAMLKTKELALAWSETYHPLELRHGPMSIVNSESLVVGLISDSQQIAEAQVLRDMKNLGAKTLVLTEDSSKCDWSDMTHVVEIRSGLSEDHRGILYLPLIQWLGFHHSFAKGNDPDNPSHLSQVIELSGSAFSGLTDSN